MKRNMGQRADGTLLPRNSDSNIFTPKNLRGKQGNCSGGDRCVLSITTHKQSGCGEPLSPNSSPPPSSLLGQYTHTNITPSPS